MERQSRDYSSRRGGEVDMAMGRGGEREGHADGSFMQGAIVNQSRGSVSRVCGPGVTTGRAGMIEGEEREGGIGTINIVFATILGTSAERPAL